ncbi:hypothetical protein CB0940_10675 [Cercospora beticola]|uniref:Uncharacterized protein n=1 Tax=Cercospora beticola TaxID=122368 RepID=A0A2G5HTY3_CERBT|nr:hypothetical protein CB0940_10675 [Cercospora beticola]PIA95743.1 hypothetical protein CB0940_10675 [Cercospora beticola]WPB07402.1 hypothetical protein RHO25_012063 [Cercospora beticola]CAK1367385.1 unnamed protein product [Cercospora beticola]
MQEQHGQFQANPMQGHYRGIASQNEQTPAERISDLEKQLNELRTQTELQGKRYSWLTQEQGAQIENLEQVKQSLQIKCAGLEQRAIGVSIQLFEQLVNQNNIILQAVQRSNNAAPGLEHRLQESEKNNANLTQQLDNWAAIFQQNNTSLLTLCGEHARAMEKCRSEKLDDDVSPEFRMDPVLQVADHWDPLFKLKNA